LNTQGQAKDPDEEPKHELPGQVSSMNGGYHGTI
jgi:hypothetical protein